MCHLLSMDQYELQIRMLQEGRRVGGCGEMTCQGGVPQAVVIIFLKTQYHKHTTQSMPCSFDYRDSDAQIAFFSH